MPTSIAFLGLGLMGARQVPHLVAAGFPMVVWNRSRGKAEALGNLGVSIAATPAEAAANADIIVTMLTSGSAVEEVLFGADGVAETIRPGSIVIDMSSILPSEAREHASRLMKNEAHHLDAPVSGGTVGAEAGTLSIMVGGEAEIVKRARPVLQAQGRITHVGPSGAGQIAKLANQLVVAVTIGAVSEALVFAERAGADPAKVREALTGGFADSRILDLHGARMVNRDFAPRGRTSIQIKDLDNILATGSAFGMQSPFTHLAKSLFTDLIAHEGDVDHAGLWLELNRLNGGKNV